MVPKGWKPVRQSSKGSDGGCHLIGEWKRERLLLPIRIFSLLSIPANLGGGGGGLLETL